MPFLQDLGSISVMICSMEDSSTMSGKLWQRMSSNYHRKPVVRQCASFGLMMVISSGTALLMRSRSSTDTAREKNSYYLEKRDMFVKLDEVL